MATDNGLRFSENVIEADNMYQILLTLLQEALWYMHQVQSRETMEKIWSIKVTVSPEYGKVIITLSCT